MPTLSIHPTALRRGVSPVTGPSGTPPPTPRAARAGTRRHLRASAAAIPGFESTAWLVVTAGLALLVIAWAVVVFNVPNVSYVLFDPRTKTGLEVLRARSVSSPRSCLSCFPTRRCASSFAGSRWDLYCWDSAVSDLAISIRCSCGRSVSRKACMGRFLFAWRRRLPWRSGLHSDATPALPTWISGSRGRNGPRGLARTRARGQPAHPDDAGETLTDRRVGGTGPLPGLRPAHWGLSLVPLVLASIAAVGASPAMPTRESVAGSRRRWCSLRDSSSTLLWPSAYSPAFTTSDVLRLAFTVVVTTGVINELRNIAAERTVLLAQERMYTRRLEDLAVLRADFTAMVAHELASPLAGIRRSAELIDPSVLPVIQQRAIETIQSESKVLAALVDDVQVSARAEREDFAVRPRPVPIADIVAAAASYGRSIGGDHSIDVTIAASDKVLADPDRIGQVLLRNLVSNAVKFSPDGTTISLCAVPIPHGKVRFEVIDRGWGIHPDDMSRIFEKFGRGRSLGEDQAGPVPGVGLGSISPAGSSASGSELNVASDPGRETRFWFDLERIA